MTDFVSGSISIGADLVIIQEMLVEHRCIEEWEKGFESFKELHVSDGMKTIVHWDIKYDIDYLFSVTENNDSVLLELIIGDLTKLPSERHSLEEMQYYVDTVLYRVKTMSERIQVAIAHDQCTS